MLFGMLALGASFTACNQEELGTRNAKTGNISVKAIRGDGTKTNVGSVVSWASGDMIKVFSSIGDSAVLTLSSGENTSAATFTGSIPNTAAVSGRNFFGIYPAQSHAPKNVTSSYYIMWKAYLPGTANQFTIQFNVPECQQQDLSDPKSLGKYTLMVATPVQYENAISTASDIELSFNQLCTILDFQLNNIPAGTTVQRVAVKSTLPGELAFNVRGAGKISLTPSDPDFLQLKPLAQMPNVNRGASYSDLLYVKTSNVTEGSKASIVTLPVNFSASPKDLQIVVTVHNGSTGQTTDLVFNKSQVSTNFERGKRYLTVLNLAAPSFTETVIYRDDFQWVSADAARNNYFDCPGLTNDLGYSFWAVADTAVGWKPGNANTYMRSAGYLKLGKTSYGGEIISPKLNEKIGLNQSYPYVTVRARLSAYTSVGGTMDNAFINVYATGGATVLTSMPLALTSYGQFKTYEFTVFGFTPTTRIGFISNNGIAVQAATNRFFIDDFEIVVPELLL